MADLETGRTSREWIWAGSDIITGAVTVIQAMGAGRRSALDMLAYFNLSDVCSMDEVA